MMLENVLQFTGAMLVIAFAAVLVTGAAGVVVMMVRAIINLLRGKA